MSVDLDDCTFWFTSEDVQVQDTWSTFVDSFNFPSCRTSALDCIVQVPFLRESGCNMVDDNCNGIVNITRTHNPYT